MIDLSCRIISLGNAAEFPIFCRTLSEALSNLRATTFVTLHEMALSSSCIQNVSNWHAPFDFLSHSVAVAT